MALTAGTRLGPYEIQAPLGAGGMGEVYRARDTRLDRQVAIKVLSSERDTAPGSRERFERDALLDKIRKAPEFVQFMTESKATVDGYRREFERR